MQNTQGAVKFKRRLKLNRSHFEIYLLFLPVLIWYIVFCYVPMGGVVIAFKDFKILKGIAASKWVGFKNFEYLFSLPSFKQAVSNTIIMGVQRICFAFPLPIVFALLLNEIKHQKYRKTMQTIAFLPHFISTVVIVGMIKLFLSPSAGIINTALGVFGVDPINFMAEPEMFPHIYVWSGIWQGLGWSAVLYIAALGGVDPQLHEAAQLDGASRLKRMWHVDIPGILPTITIVFIMNMGRIMNVGFEKVYLMQNDLNIATSETIATYTYKQGLEQAKYSYSTATGIFNSLVNIAMLVFFNTVSRKVTETSLW